MVRNAEQFASAAETDNANTPGMCLQATREWADIPPAYPDAATAWRNAHDRRGDRDPPRGSAVYWTGGSRGFGHIACSLGNGLIRSTDAGGTGLVATRPLSFFDSWNLDYAGWCDNINEIDIPPVPPPPPTGVKLHLMQASMQFSNGRPKTRHDLDVIYSREADVIGHTEAINMHPLIRQAARDHGYRTYLPRVGDGALSVRKPHLIRDKGYEPVLEAGPGHAARGITWVRIGFHDEDVYIDAAHWLGQAHDNPKPHKQMSKALVELVRKQAVGQPLAFWMGDTNVDDGRKIPFYDNIVDAHLTSVWDELDRHPPTLGRRTVDIVGSYNHDGRVSALRAKAWGRNTTEVDHRQVSAWYFIKPSRRD